MHVLVLGAGYATRLYPLTRERPKPLLPVHGVPILQRIMERILPLPDLRHIHVVTNHKFANHYSGWLKEYRFLKTPLVPIEVHDDMTMNNDDRLGAVGDIQFVVEKAKIKDDLLVVAGDNLLEFDLLPFVTFAREHGSAVGLKDLKGSDLISQYSTVTLDKKSKIVDFEEKPPMPKSSLISIGLYHFAAKHVPLTRKYIDQGHTPDAPGYYVQWLHKQIDLYGYVIEGSWFDIGDIDSYNKANELPLDNSHASRGN